MAGAGALWEQAREPADDPPAVSGARRSSIRRSSLNYRKGATNSFLQGDWLYSPTLNKNEFSTRTYDDGTVITQQMKRNRRTDYATLNAGVDHAFGARNTVSVSGLFNREKIIDHGDNPYFDGALQNRYRLWQFLEDEVKYTAFGTAVAHAPLRAARAHARVHGELLVPPRGREVLLHEHAARRPSAPTRSSCSPTSTSSTSTRTTSKPLRQGRVEAGFKGRYRSIPVEHAVLRRAELADRHRRRRLGDVPRDDSGGLRQLRVRERAHRARGRRPPRGRPAGLRREPGPQHVQERRLPLLPAVPERARGLEVRRRRTSSRCSSTGASTGRTKSTSASSRSTTSRS